MVANPNNEPRHYFTLDEYFALEHTGDARYEYWDGDIVCMSGASRAHGEIVGNIHYRLRQKLEGGNCRALTGDTPIWTPAIPPYRYPDASVVCGELKFGTIRGIDALSNPVLIVEVLSPTAERLDREDKFAAYKTIETFREYLLVAQDSPQVTHYIWHPDGWSREHVTGLKGAVSLAAIGCSLNLAEIYENVLFNQ